MIRMIPHQPDYAAYEGSSAIFFNDFNGLPLKIKLEGQVIQDETLQILCLNLV